MKKKEALAVLESRITNKEIDAEAMDFTAEAECEIRKLADLDEGFSNTVFELGCSTLAKAYLKAKNK